MTNRRAFTLLELLVVIAIVAIMMGLLFFSFRGVRGAATRAESQSALRQMIMAYNSYAADDKMRLMPGYLDQTGLVDLRTNVRLEDGNLLFDWETPTGCSGQVCDVSSYVWRMAPYLDYAWQTYLTDYRSKTIESIIQSELSDPASPVYGPGTAAGNQLGLAGVPAFGMNSIYVGGDTSHGGSTMTQYHPWQTTNDTVAATRLSAVKNPAKLIVFGPTGLADPDPASPSPYVLPDALEFPVGYVELRPPMLIVGDPNSPVYENLEWSVAAGGEVLRGPMANLDDGAGLPIARWGKEIMPVANLDGSATMETISHLMKDMSRWRAFE